MKKEPLITVIIPIYNIEKYVGKCIESVCSQTYQNIEILLIDDCSKDGSLQICNQYAQMDNRIVVIHNTVNKGIAAVRNLGLRQAKGIFYLFVDGDDYIASDLCERAINAVSTTGIDTVHWGYECIDEAGNTFSRIEPILSEQRIISHDEIFDKILNTFVVSIDDLYYWFSHSMSYYEAIHSKKQLASVCRYLLSAKIIKDNKLCFPDDISRGEDIVFLFGYLQCIQEIVNISGSAYYYLQRSNSLMRNDTDIENKIKLMEAMDCTVAYAPESKRELLRDKWRGQRILIAMNTARNMAKVHGLWKGYKEYRRLAAHPITVDAYSKIQLSGVPIKYRIAIGMNKYRLYFLFYLCVYLMKLMHVDMAPMD